MRWIKRHGFATIWAAAALLALMVYGLWHVGDSILGLVEVRTHALSSSEDGRVGQVLVSLGEEVRASQVLAELDIGRMEAEARGLREEIAQIERNLGADRQRYGLEVERLHLQSRTDALRIARRQADLEAKRAELAAMDHEIDRLSRAEEAGLGQPRDLPDLIIRRDSARRWIEETQALATGAGRSKAPATAGASDPDDVVLSMLGNRLDRLMELRLELGVVESRLVQRRVISPCDGRVVGIHAMPGDAVEAFVPIVTVEESRVSFVDAYIPERSSLLPQVGQRASIRPYRSGNVSAEGTVVSVDPGYSALPERLKYRGAINWARRFRIRLDEGHPLMPGEGAEVRVHGPAGAAGSAQAAVPPPGTNAPRVTTTAPSYSVESLPVMDIPRELRQASPIEPSGVIWLPDIDRYLVISDDTGYGDQEHQPWAFLMDRQGRMEARPVPIEGCDRLTDLESVTAGGDGVLYLVSSQSVSKKGKRPLARQQLIRLARSGRDLRVTGSVDFLNVLAASYGSEQLRDLGLDPTDSAGELELNIEGAAWWDGKLLLGLKQPRPLDGALLWQLQNPDGLLEDQVLKPGQLSVIARPDLRTPDGTPAAFSDLMVDRRQEIYALSTVPGESTAEQVSGLFRLARPGAESAGPERLCTFLRGKAEGLCVSDDGRFIVVFDTDDDQRVPYVTLEAPTP